MKKFITKNFYLYVLVFLTLSHVVKCQKQTGADQLKALGLPPTFFEQTDDKVNYTFDGKIVIKSWSQASTPIVTTQIFIYDPAQIKKKYKLISVDSAAPTPAQVKEFDRSHNEGDLTEMGKLDPQSIKLISEDSLEMVIGFKYLPKSLPL